MARHDRQARGRAAGRWWRESSSPTGAERSSDQPRSGSAGDTARQCGRMGSRRNDGMRLPGNASACTDHYRVGIGGEVSGALGQRGTLVRRGEAFARQTAFVVGEEEGFVFPNRAAERPAELVALVARVGLSGGREEVTGVERGVAEELVGGAVERVGTGLQRHGVPGVARERGVVAEVATSNSRMPSTGEVMAAPFNFGSRRCKRRRAKRFASSRAPFTLIAEVAADASGGTLGRGRNTRQQQRQLIVVAAIQRQVDNLLIGQQAALPADSVLSRGAEPRTSTCCRSPVRTSGASSSSSWFSPSVVCASEWRTRAR